MDKLKDLAQNENAMPLLKHQGEKVQLKVLRYKPFFLLHPSLSQPIMVLFIFCLILHSLGMQMHADSCRYQGTWPHQCDHSPSDARCLLPPAFRLLHRALEWVEKSRQTPFLVVHHPDPQQMDDPPPSGYFQDALGIWIHRG